jgi:DNA-binding transcriptional regulator YdaS (Cro superfamily)
MTESAGVIIQVPAGSAVDRQLMDVPPPSVADHRTVVERIAADAAGRIEPPAAGQVVLSFLSPEALSREAEAVSLEIGQADSNKPPVVVLEVVEELREDEFSVLLQAAERAQRTVILCILSSI